MSAQNDNFDGVIGNHIPIRTIYVAPIEADVSEILGNLSLN